MNSPSTYTKLLFVSLLTVGHFAQAQDFSAVVDITGGSDTYYMTFGFSPDATDGYDDGLDQYAPPAPPPPAFDAALSWQGERYYTQILAGDGDLSEHEYSIALAYDTNNLITLNWDNTGWSDMMSSCQLQDAFGGLLGIDIDMTTETSLTLTNPAFSSLLLKVTPNDYAGGPDAYPVTFTVVDDGNDYTNVALKGQMTGWANVDMNNDGSGSWTLTLDLEAGSYEWGAVAILDDGAEVWLPSLAGFDSNPVVVVGPDGSVSGDTGFTVPCQTCSPEYTVTFQLDNTWGSVPCDGNPWVTGSMDGWSGWGAELSDGGDGIFMASMVLNANEDVAYEYKYTCGGWDQVEDVPDECAYNTEWHNRGFFLVDGDVVLDSHPWSGCPGDGPPPTGPEFSVTLSASSGSDSYDLVAGFSSSATDGFDPNIDDYAPPAPPPPAFDAALGWEMDRYFIQILGSSEGDFGEAHVFEVLLQYNESGVVDLAWDNSGWNDQGTFTLTDAFGGDLLSVNMNEESGVSVSDHTTLHFSITPGTYEPPPPAGPDVFFSEYAEGSSSNKYLEIYNGTGGAVSLDDFVILGNYNGNPFSETFTFAAGATLESGDVYVIANADASDDILALADEVLAYADPWYTAAFNGDDVRALATATDPENNILDIIGTLEGGDPGSGWPVAGVDAATKDHTLVRKDEVSSGNGGDWASSAGTNADDSEWIVAERPTADYTPATLGWHINEPVPPGLIFSDGMDSIEEYANYILVADSHEMTSHDGESVSKQTRHNNINGWDIGTHMYRAHGCEDSGLSGLDDGNYIVKARVWVESLTDGEFFSVYVSHFGGDCSNWWENWSAGLYQADSILVPTNGWVDIEMPVVGNFASYANVEVGLGLFGPENTGSVAYVDYFSLEEGEEAATVDVTFQVNMAYQDAADGVYLAGGTIGPMADPSTPSMGYQMSDDNGDNIYELTLTLDQNMVDYYTYKYRVGPSYGWEGNWENVPAECGIGTYSDRYFNTGEEDMNLGPVCFSSCEDCAEETVLLTFNLDMSDVDTSPDGVFVGGGGTFGVPGDNPMSDDDGDDIWTLSFELPAGLSTDYTFLNGNCGDWSCKEDIGGQDCAVPPYNDRHIDLGTEDVTVNACFAVCGDGFCDELTPPDFADVTFQVDMSEVDLENYVDNNGEGFYGVYVTGSFDGWAGWGTQLYDDDGDGVYTGTREIGEGVWEYLFTVNGWNGLIGNAPIGSECDYFPADDYANYGLSVGTEDMVLDVVCWMSCSECEDEPPPSGDPDFSGTINATGGSDTYYLTFGFSPDATDGFDDGMDSYAPPAPPPPSFDAALTWAGDRYYTQILNGSADDLVEHEYGVALAYDTNNLIELTWDNTGWSGMMSSCVLQDAFGGVLGIDIDMLSETSLTLTNPAFSSLLLKVTPLSGSDEPDTYPVTFTVVDDGNDYTNVALKGQMTGWANVAMNNDGSGTWTLTLDLESGSYEWGAVAILDDNTEIWLPSLAGFDSNPTVVVGPDGSVSGDTGFTVPCQTCAEEYDVTFQLTEHPCDGNPWVTGSMDGWSGWGAELSDGDGDGVFAATWALYANPDVAYEYKYTCGGWDQVEDVPDECAYNTEWHNRGFFLVDGDLVLEQHAWSGCPGDEPPPSADPDFSGTINATGGSDTYYLTFGFSPNATDGFDDGVDSYAPPAPPPPSFDAALTWAGDRYYTQILNGSADDLVEHEYGVALAYDTNNLIELTWDNTGWSGMMSSCVLQDAFGGVLGIDIDMLSESSLTLTNPAFSSLLLKVTPAGPPEPPAFPDIFFSEAAEGSSNNKYLEIYNGTDGDVDLSGFSLSSCSNGCDEEGVFDYPDNVTFEAVLASGDVWVVCHGSASDGIQAECDQTFTYLSNGDDAFALTVAGSLEILDIIGDMGADPGGGWPVAGVDEATKDHTLVRKDEVSSGNGGDWASSAGTNADDSEWIVAERPTADYTPATLGWHIDEPAGDNWGCLDPDALNYDPDSDGCEDGSNDCCDYETPPMDLTIYEIQGQADASPYVDVSVSTSGVVTGATSSGFWMQDGDGAWSGIWCYDGGVNEVVIGDNVTVVGTVIEYYDLTEIEIDAVTVNSSNNGAPEPAWLPTGDFNEAFESVVVEAEGVCDNNDLGYGEWSIDDGSGPGRVDDKMYAYSAVIGNAYAVAGPLDFSYGDFKIQPRDENDVEEISDGPSAPSNLTATAGVESVELEWDAIGDDDAPPVCVQDCEGIWDLDEDDPWGFCTWVTTTLVESGCAEDCEGEELDDVSEVIEDCTDCIAEGDCEDRNRDGADFAIEVNVHGDGQSMVLTTGFSPDATDGYDDGIDTYAPPAPPPPSFDAALNWAGDRYYTQILAGDGDYSAHEINVMLQYGADNCVSADWDNTGWSDLGSFVLQDAFGGAMISIDMTAESSVESCNPAFTVLVLVMTPFEPPPPPEGVPDFTFNFNVAGGTQGGNYDLAVGFSPGATDGYDDGLDSYAPPSPPPPAFDAALMWDGDRYFTQILNGSLDDIGVEHTFGIALTYDSDNYINITWDNSGLSDLGTFILEDSFGGSMINVNMANVNSLVLDNPAFTSLNLKVTPGEGGDAEDTFNVYRDGSLAAEGVLGTSYTDAPLTGGVEYCYTVTQIHDDGSESDHSNVACATPEDGAVPGCTDPNASNYDPDATVDDGSCFYEETVNVDLSAGWNWFSLNVEGDLDVNAVLESIGGSGILIKDQSSYAMYSDDAWIGVGGLESFDMTSMYMIQMGEDDMLTYEGVPIDHSTTSIGLSAGWNWISYLPQSGNTVGDALANIGDSGDFIKNQSSFANYYQGYGWFADGGLENMMPLDGFKIVMGEAASLTYTDPPEGALTRTILSEPVNSPWEIDHHAFEHSMTIVGVLMIDDEESMDHGDVIAAFSGEECRGIAGLNYHPVADRYTTGIMVHGYEQGEEIRFSVYDASSGDIKELENRLTFDVNASIGNGLSPVVFKAVSIPEEYAVSQNYPNPFNPVTNIRFDLPEETDVSVSVFNARGQLVTELTTGNYPAGYHFVKWNGTDAHGSPVSSGVYIYSVKAGDYHTFRKMLLVK